MRKKSKEGKKERKNKERKKERNRALRRFCVLI